MRRSKRRITSFINHLFGVYNVPRIPVYIHWYHDSIIVGNEACFGVFHSDDNGKYCIHAAASKIKTSKLHEAIAHEFCHYLQFLKNRDMDDPQIEDDAKYWAAGLYGQWLINKRKKNEHCYGVTNIWERHNDS